LKQLGMNVMPLETALPSYCVPGCQQYQHGSCMNSKLASILVPFNAESCNFCMINILRNATPDKFLYDAK